MIPRPEDEPGRARVQVRLGRFPSLEGFESVQPVKEIRPGGAAGSGAADAAWERIAFGEQGGQQRGLTRPAEAVPLDQEPGQARVDRQAGHRPPGGGDAVIVDRAELPEQEGGGRER